MDAHPGVTHPRRVRRVLPTVVSAALLAGCPGPSDDSTAPPDDRTVGGETLREGDIPWPDGLVTELAKRETLSALEELGEPLEPLAFVVRLDVAFAGDSEGALLWVRFGVVLGAEGLRVFDARPLEVTVADHGEPPGTGPLADLARALTGLPLLEPSGCEAVGGAQACAPLLELVESAADPAQLTSGGNPVRLAPGDRGIVARDGDGATVLVDSIVEGAPRVTRLDEIPGASAD